MWIDSFLFRLVRNPVSTCVLSPALRRHVITIWRNAKKIIFGYLLRNIAILSYFLSMLVSVRSDCQHCLCKILLVAQSNLLPFARPFAAVPYTSDAVRDSPRDFVSCLPFLSIIQLLHVFPEENIWRVSSGKRGALHDQFSDIHTCCLSADMRWRVVVVLPRV
jgi:hypothetical protein